MSKAMRWSALLICCVSGCTFLSKGQTHAEYNHSSNSPAMTVAAQSGRYALYVGDDPIACCVQILKKGEPLGFERNDEGRIRAVAGNYSATLPKNLMMAKWVPLKNTLD